uniref:Uncharacterized protein n=1 Tax=viral metagenome TaxID=1070528 RepID=A0A6M3KUI5_9ZZZZ
MAINVKVNADLVRMLREMGVLSADAEPLVAAPISMVTDILAGDASGGTATLSQTPIDNGIVGAVSLVTASGSNNTLAKITEDTDYSVEDVTLTYLTDQSGKQVMITYSY